MTTTPQYPQSRNRCSTGIGRALLLGVLFALPLVNPGSSWAKPGDGLIVFESNRGGQSDIWVMEADGSNARNLTNDKIGDLFPSWSRDGKKIAWTRGGRTPSGEIWIMNLDGSGRTRITSNGFADYNATWSPDGSRIIFQSPRVGGRSDLFVIGTDGTGEQQLTNDPASDIAPDWSPDGSRVAFASNRSGHYAVYTMNPDGSDVQKLTEDAQEAAIPGWSPDGARILFIDGFCDICGESDLFVVNADGSGLTQITDTPENEGSKSWSRDGLGCIAEVGDVTPGHLAKSDLAVIDLATGEATQLTDTKNIIEAHPAWAQVARSLPSAASGRATHANLASGSVRVGAVSGTEPALVYALPRAGWIDIRVYDVRGRAVGAIAGEWQSSGAHHMPLALKGRGSGVYLYRLQWEGNVSTGKIVLAR